MCQWVVSSLFASTHIIDIGLSFPGVVHKDWYIYNNNEIVLFYSNSTPAPPICAPFGVYLRASPM